MKKLPISLTVITKNEEHNIERCLRSAPFVSEIVVVDSDSTDRTQEKARSLGAEVYNENWRGFGPQRRLAVAKCNYDWILTLDADEALSPELSKEIQDRFTDLEPQVGYQFPRISFHLGRWIRHGGWYPDYQLRLFNRKHSQWDEAVIHEKVIAPRTQKFQHPIRHWVFQDLFHQVQTNNRYSTLQAEDLHKKGKGFSFWKLIFKPKSKFFETYVFKLGFLDGRAGFIIAVGAAYSVFLKWSKLWELEKLKDKKEVRP